MSRGRREGKKGAVSIRDSSLPRISPPQTNMCTSTCTCEEVQTMVELAKVKRFAILQEQAGIQEDA